MKAVITHGRGPDDVSVAEVDRPQVAPDSILVRVKAASLNTADTTRLSGLPRLPGARRPVVLGSDFAGTVEEVGAEVTTFEPGDDVFGDARGAFAEYLCVPASLASRSVVAMPAAMSFEDAAALGIAGVTALQAVRKHGRVRPGQRVLVNGASGAVGTFAVQLARVAGAHVTAVCSARNVELVRSLGADEVLDYTHEDFTLRDARYDVMIDIAGSRGWTACKRVLAADATVVLVGASAVLHRNGGLWLALRHIAGVKVLSMFGRRRAVVFLARISPDELKELADLVVAGRIKPAIEQRFPLDEALTAVRVLTGGHSRAKLVFSPI